MENNIERDLGVQPISEIMEKHRLKPNDLVQASSMQLTHKMVSRACKGRRLTANVKFKVLNALNKSIKASYSQADLFNY